MNKQLDEGKRLAEVAKNAPYDFKSEFPPGIWSNLGSHLDFHTPDRMLEIYAHIEKLEALNNLAQDIVTHPCWIVNSEIPKSLKARRDLYVEAWNALEESE